MAKWTFDPDDGHRSYALGHRAEVRRWTHPVRIVWSVCRVGRHGHLTQVAHGSARSVNQGKAIASAVVRARLDHG